MSPLLSQRIARELTERRAQHLYRSRRVCTSPQGARIRIDGRTLLNFCSNDYLGLASHPALIAALDEGAARYGVGSGAAHLINGHSAAHHALEEELADFVGRPRALLFSTGYMANLGTIAALMGRDDLIVEDRLNHASLIDGARFSGARVRRYRHRDTEHARELLGTTERGARLIVTDGVFSMDGDLAPIARLSALAKESSADVLVDDAHGLGVIGATGRGTLEVLGATPRDVPILIGTLGKAFGTFGAFVAGDGELIEYLIQSARSYIYTTALPPAIAHATLASLRLVREDGWRRDRLQSLVARFRAGARQLGLLLHDSSTPIQPILVHDAARALAMSAALAERGILIQPIRPPTVPDGQARLRVTFSAAHEAHDVDQLLDALAQLQ
jgi:8-amino-7-oxononanoate synthase